jgi:hypothetical protein
LCIKNVWGKIIANRKGCGNLAVVACSEVPPMYLSGGIEQNYETHHQGNHSLRRDVNPELLDYKKKIYSYSHEYRYYPFQLAVRFVCTLAATVSTTAMRKQYGPNMNIFPWFFCQTEYANNDK